MSTYSDIFVFALPVPVQLEFDGHGHWVMIGADVSYRK